MLATHLIVFFTLLSIGYVELAFDACKDHRYYIEEKTERTVLVRYDASERIEDCIDYGSPSFSEKIIFRLSNNCVSKVNEDEMNKTITQCPRTENRSYLSLIWEKRPQYKYNIFPGTKWCGAGNISDQVLDTGILSELDECCRTHDHCPDFIGVGKTEHGITNDGLGSYSLCDCDDEFINCLHSVGNVAADNVGFLFFNLVAMPCFKKDYPIVKCLKKERGTFKKQCQEYEQDTSKEPVYQLFDSKIYKPS